MTRRVMISGAMSHYPLGGAGNTWAFLQYILGFQQLGVETYYVEQLDAKDCVDEAGNSSSFAAGINARYFRDVMEHFGLSECSALLEGEGEGYVGLSCAEVERLAASVDLLINLSGRLRLPRIVGAVRRKMYLDMDPGYTQIWQAQYGVDMNLRGHDVYVTVGLNLGKPTCPLPTCGLNWQSTLPPVMLDEWTTTEPPGAAYSTIADWRGFRPIEWQGVWYGQKSDEFLRVLELPQRVAASFELCLLIHPEEQNRETLTQHGWRLTSPAVHAATPDSYRKYIRRSRGEFTVVKPGYALGRSGWFSDRSAVYLAAGRPVIVQETGMSQYLPTGSGLLTFTDLESAAAAVKKVEQQYTHHAAAAAAFAREHLDARRVLPRLLHLAGV